MRTQQRQGAGSAHTAGKKAANDRLMTRCGKVVGTGSLAVMLAMNGLTVTPASSAPNFSIIVSKNDSIVLAEGVAGEVSVEVLRNGVRVGLAQGLAVGSAFEVNHAAAVTECWDDFTPEILAGDVVTVTSGGVTDAVTVAGVEVTEGPTMQDPGGGVGTVKGVVATPRPPIEALSVETRGDSAVRFRSVAIGGEPGSEGGVTTTLAYDDATSGSFTATFDGLNQQQRTAFLESFEVSATVTTGRNGEANLSATAAVFGATPGSEDPACPQVIAQRAVTTLSEVMVNIANQGAALAIGGKSVDATAVTATVTDRNGVTREAAPAVPTPAPASVGTQQTWQTSLPAGELAGLADGPLTVAATYTEGGGTTSGSSRILRKDTVAPTAPTITPNGAAFTGSRQVNVLAPNDDIMFTLNGSTPSLLNGVPFRGPITLSESATLKAVAVDAFGNVSPVAQAVFTRLTPPEQNPPAQGAPGQGTPGRGAPGQEAPGQSTPGKNAPAAASAPQAPRRVKARPGARGGRATAKVRWAPPLLDGGSAITAYVLTALRIVDGKVVGRTTVRLPGTARSAQVKLRRGKYKFHMRAVNAVGRSAVSFRSNTARAR